MVAFLISSAIGFTVYQLVAWALVSRDGSSLNFGDSQLELSPNAATWLRRIVAVVLIGVGLWLIFWLHRLFGLRSESPGGAVLLGFVYGPLLAIWINTLVATPPDDGPSAGQYVAGAGLVLLFLVGSVGESAEQLIKEYARRINKISVGGAELSFVQKNSDKGSLGGSLSLSGITPTYASSTGAVGLDYLDRLAKMIERDIEYLEVFREAELQREKAKRTGADPAADRELAIKIEEKKKETQEVLISLRTAKAFAEMTIKPPAACLVGWYTVTGDVDSINRHMAALANVFKRLPTIESGHPVEQLAEEFIDRSFIIVRDAVASVPSYLLADKCDALLYQFCPSAFRSVSAKKLNDVGLYKEETKRERNDDPRASGDCLREIQSAVLQKRKVPVFETLQRELEPALADFVKSRGWQARPYFALGYASILSQLEQNLAASALLDNWIHMRSQRPERPMPVWETAADWFDLRVRSILVNFLEVWLKKEGASAPTAVRDEHIANLDIVRLDLKSRLEQVDFFQDVVASIGAPPANNWQDKFRLDDRTRDPASCFSKDPYLDRWQRLFETYVTAELTYLNAILSHPDYSDRFSEQATTAAAALAGMNLSCIPRDREWEKGLVHPRARTYYAQALDAFGTNAYLYSDSHREFESASVRQQRLEGAIHAVEFGLNLIREISRKARDRNGMSFLQRIEASDAVEVEEKLKATAKKLKRMMKENE
ncbi:hypothetical protein [Bradyrhizobium sp. URHC0002]